MRKHRDGALVIILPLCPQKLTAVTLGGKDLFYLRFPERVKSNMTGKVEQQEYVTQAAHILD